MNHSKVDQKERDSRKHYRVIADRDKGDDPQWGQVESGDRVWFSGPRDDVDRIERPVPTEPCLSTANHVGHEWGSHKDQPGTGYWCRGFDASDEPPSLPTREQIAEARTNAQALAQQVIDLMEDDDVTERVQADLADIEHVLALLQKGADREWPAADDGSDLTWRERNGADRG